MRIMKIVVALPLAAAISLPVQAAEFGIFSDVTFSDSGVEGENAQFALGPLDFYGTAQIDDNTRVFVEYVFENAGEGLITDLERLWIGRTISDQLTISMGRFHSPLGYWNRTYHHGAILQDTVSRPFFVEFEDGAGAILPVHIVGVLATGSFSVGGGDLGYEAYVANGPSIDTSLAVDEREIDINDSGDPNSDKSYGFRLTFVPEEVDLSLGFFAMSNVVADSGGSVTTQGGDLVSQTIAGFDVAYRMGDVDFIVEYYNFSNEDEAGSLGSTSASAYYVQAGYQATEVVKVSVRYETLDSDEDGDRYFKEIGVRNQSHYVAAIRYDLDDTNALKFEVNQTKPEAAGADDTTAYILQWAFLVP